MAECSLVSDWLLTCSRNSLLIWNQKVCHCCCKIPPSDPILNDFYSFDILITCVILIQSTYAMFSRIVYFPEYLEPKGCVRFVSSPHMFHLYDLITQKRLCDWDRFLSYALCYLSPSTPPPPLISYFSGSK